MADDFEDHCWKDIVPAEVFDIYSHYVRKTFVGPTPALLAIDLYELAYQGGAKAVVELHKTYASSCGEHAYAAIEPTKRLFAAARAAGLPVFYTTQDARPDSLPARVVITKQRASGFYGTPLMAHLTGLGIRTIIICGESTSGCVRASAVDAYSNGFHVVLVEDCCFDRSVLSHKVNLFDLHHKYADVMHVDEVVAHLDGLTVRKAS
jgi:nicotinamidase-related amidase